MENKKDVILNMGYFKEDKLSLTFEQFRLLKWLDRNDYLNSELKVTYLSENEWEEI